MPSFVTPESASSFVAPLLLVIGDGDEEEMLDTDVIRP